MPPFARQSRESGSARMKRREFLGMAGLSIAGAVMPRGVQAAEVKKPN